MAVKHYPHPIIAREGWPYLAMILALSLALTFSVGWVWALPSWLLSLFVLQFFRDPPRQVPQGANLVIAPADGRIVAVERGEDPYLKRDSIKISVFMNVFNAHSNRSPVDGVVRQIWYHAGSFVNASLSKASLENERNALWIHTDGGHDVTAVQVAGLIARRILCYAKPQQHLARGDRYGFIRFGSRVDVFMPVEAEVVVAVGDKVYAGEAVLARLPASPAA